MSVIGLLKELGFTESEAKVYLSLTQNGFQTGYEVSKSSGVPRSKVYTILESLSKDGIVSFSQSKRAKLYKAESIDIVCSLAEQRLHQTSRLVQQEVSQLHYAQEDEQIWEMVDWPTAKMKCLTLLEKAEHQVLMQVWASELDLILEAALEKVEKRIKEFLVVYYDEKQAYSTKLVHVYHHGYEQDKLADMKGRWLLLTIDGQAMLYVTFDEKGFTHAIYTRKREMAFFAREYIMHDAYCLKILNRIEDSPLMSRMTDIRNVFSRE